MTVPKHVAIILDGNRRFALRLMEKPWKGHEWGAQKVEQLLDWCKDAGVQELTLYAFSLQNFKRPKKEFDYLMKINQEAIRKILSDDRLARLDLRVHYIGLLHLFPKELQAAIKEVERKTEKHKSYLLNICLGYGGHEEILHAVRSIVKEVEAGSIHADDVTADLFSKHLWLSSEPDLVIRTGGEKRTSNFLPWQTWYSEWFFTDKMWPEFEKKDFDAIIAEYGARIRRFGA